MKRISIEQALEFAEAYLKQRKEKYLCICELTEKDFIPDKDLISGPYYGQIRDVWVVPYEVQWTPYETKSFFIHMDAYTGEVFYTLTPHGFAEDWD